MISLECILKEIQKYPGDHRGSVLDYCNRVNVTVGKSQMFSRAYKIMLSVTYAWIYVCMYVKVMYTVVY